MINNPIDIIDIGRHILLACFYMRLYLVDFNAYFTIRANTQISFLLSFMITISH